jgi:hypothetical protein
MKVQSNFVGAVSDERASHFFEIPFQGSLLFNITENHSKMNCFRRGHIGILGIGTIVSKGSVILVFIAMLNRC